MKRKAEIVLIDARNRLLDCICGRGDDAELIDRIDEVLSGMHNEARELSSQTVCLCGDARCRVVSRSYQGEWWTPQPGDIVKLRDGESIEWEAA